MSDLPIPRNPECRDGKHSNCQGDAWDETNDAPALCECPCHFGIKAGAA